MRILVPGGTGFIGKHLCKGLADTKHELAIMTRGLLKPEVSNIKFFKGDVTDFDVVKNIVSEFKPDVIVDLADALYTLTRDPRDYIKTNVIGLVNLLELSKEYNSRLVFVSSSGVYGNVKDKASESSPVNPQSPYEISKWSGERYCLFYNRMFKVPVMIIRVFNAYGPGQNPKAKGGVIANFITKVLNDRSPTVSGDGKQTRDFIFIPDLIGLLVKSVDSDVSGEIFNACSSNSISMIELARQIIELCGKSDSVEPIFIPARENEIKNSVGDNSKAKKIFGWEPKTDLKSGLKKTIDYYKNLG